MNPPDVHAPANVLPFGSVAGRSGEPAQVPSRSAIKSYVDGLSVTNMLTGWACIPGDSARRVHVSVRHDGAEIATSIADALRIDVRAAGFGDGYCGFSVAIPPALANTVGARLIVRFSVDQGVEPAQVEFELPRRRTNRRLTSRIDTGARSPQTAPAIYVPGHVVSCFSPHDLPAWHTKGWHAPEAEYTWIDGQEATIEMMLRRPQVAYRLLMDVVPTDVGGPLQTLEVFFNFMRVGFFELPAERLLSIDLPSEIFILRRAQIALNCRHAVAGTHYGTSDTRRLGVAIREWVIC